MKPALIAIILLVAIAAVAAVREKYGGRLFNDFKERSIANKPYKNAFREYVMNQKKGCTHDYCSPGGSCCNGRCVCPIGAQAGSWCNCVVDPKPANPWGPGGP